MKSKMILPAFLILTGCAQQPSTESPSLSFENKAQVFSQILRGKALNGLIVCETTLFYIAGKLMFTHDIGASGRVFTSTMDSNGTNFQLNANASVDRAMHHYVVEHDGTYYMFAKRDEQIYLWKAIDAYNWQMINGGQPVVSRRQGTHLNNLWNVGVAIDDAGTWHMLIETAINVGQTDVGLAYSTATINGDYINFDANMVDNVIPNGGNPDLKFIKGKGLLSIHGILDNGWQVTASTYQNGTWATHKDFWIGPRDIPIADPSLVEIPGGIMMAVSFNQDSIYLAKTSLNLKQLFEEVTK